MQQSLDRLQLCEKLIQGVGSRGWFNAEIRILMINHLGVRKSELARSQLWQNAFR